MWTCSFSPVRFLQLPSYLVEKLYIILSCIYACFIFIGVNYSFWTSHAFVFLVCILIWFLFDFLFVSGLSVIGSLMWVCLINVAITLSWCGWEWSQKERNCIRAWIMWFLRHLLLCIFDVQVPLKVTNLATKIVPFDLILRFKKRRSSRGDTRTC